jgi:hypothetical protein
MRAAVCALTRVDAHRVRLVRVNACVICATRARAVSTRARVDERAIAARARKSRVHSITARTRCCVSRTHAVTRINADKIS